MFFNAACAPIQQLIPNDSIRTGLTSNLIYDMQMLAKKINSATEPRRESRSDVDASSAHIMWCQILHLLQI